MIYYPIGFWFYLFYKLIKKIMNIEKYKRYQIFSKYILILGWLSTWFSLSFYPDN